MFRLSPYSARAVEARLSRYAPDGRSDRGIPAIDHGGYLHIDLNEARTDDSGGAINPHYRAPGRASYAKGPGALTKRSKIASAVRYVSARAVSVGFPEGFCGNDDAPTTNRFGVCQCCW